MKIKLNYKPGHPLSILLIIYLIFSVSLFVIWKNKKVYSITGDEPHYLVIASGIANEGVIEQTLPYKIEFQTRKIFSPGLASENENPSPENSHTVRGPHGLFNVHNLGLPLLLAVPFFLGGVVGSKLFMIFLGATSVVVTWKISGIFSNQSKVRFFSTLATCIAFPLIPASSQIYPDLLAGSIALGGLYWAMTSGRQRTISQDCLFAAAISFLPWLQIKFAATAIILIAAVLLKIYFESKNIRRVLTISLIMFLSFVTLAMYNYYAFGKFSGPYLSGSLEFSKTSLMVLAGLLLDQNQGLLFQNPIMFSGLLAIGLLFHSDKKLGMLWLLVFLSLIVPNSLHPNWYGGWSFSGRFEWAAAIVFILPTMLGLAKLASVNMKIFRITIFTTILLQLYFLFLSAHGDINLYNKPAKTLLDDYSIFYYPFQAKLPAFYNVDWAYAYAPNLGWLVVVTSLIILGFFLESSTKNVKLNYVPTFLAGGGIAIAFLGSLFQLPNQSTQFQNEIYSAKNLPSLTGRVDGDARVVAEGVDNPGFITYGPSRALHKGSYLVTIRYSSDAAPTSMIGTWDIFNADAGQLIKQGVLIGTSGQQATILEKFDVSNWRPNRFEFRNVWNGKQDLRIETIELKGL